MENNNKCIVPIVSYSNTDTLKVKILEDNKKKSGVYC